MRAPEIWRNQIQRYRLVIEKCGNCEKPNMGRDVCPHCGIRIVPEGENILRRLREGETPQINGRIGMVGYGKERSD